jgi:alkylation response protein AidB-like acyl-CoA dehydrogenase
MSALTTGPDVTPDQAREEVRAWIVENVPGPWRLAGEDGGPAAVRTIRTSSEYRAWYGVFGRSGLVAPTWDVDYGGLGWSRAAAKAAEETLRPYHLPRLNPLGLNLAAPALFAHGTHEQRCRFLPPIVRADEIWCQLFSEPGSGSDLASLSTRAVRDGDDWVITGQKIWTTWANRADFAVLLARTDPDLPKHQGITYFLIDMHQDAITPRPLMHLGGEAEFFETFIDGAVVPDAQRVGEVGAGWIVAQATLSGERQMVSGAGSGGVDRVGGGSARQLVRLAQRTGGWSDPSTRDEVIRLWCEEQVRGWTNQRIRDRITQGLTPGPESSIGKVHGTDLNQRIQSAAARLMGMSGLAWPGDPGRTGERGAAGGNDAYREHMPPEVAGMLRSRANTIEGGTSEVNKNVLAERVLGLPKEFDPFRGKPWREIPRG